MENKHILLNLHSLIRNSTLAYINEFVWQDIQLTNEFKDAYSRYLNANGYDIEFLGYTAVITSSSTKYIYVPNQWFVIAAYTVNVYEELQKYKNYFKKVSDKLGKRIDIYAKEMRDLPTVAEKKEFLRCAKEIFSSYYDDGDIADEAAQRLLRFVTDYSWWSGQKTIDRADFFVSVILNMLNLVNVSQGYVADIVSAYANDEQLRNLVTSIDKFTVNMITADTEDFDSAADEEIREQTADNRQEETLDVIPKPGRVKIKISGKTSYKEIKYKG